MNTHEIDIALLEIVQQLQLSNEVDLTIIDETLGVVLRHRKPDIISYRKFVSLFCTLEAILVLDREVAIHKNVDETRI
jgi:hypothetical protein